MQNGDAKFSRMAGGDWKKIPSTIGFRLDDDHTAVLVERANALKISVHELARQYVIQMLHENDERQQLLTALVALRNEIVEARKDISVSTQELMVSGGRATVAQAKGWVKENLLPQS
jgi:HEAT repeat protein